MNNLDQVRDIIVGEDLRLINEKLSQMQNQINALRTEMKKVSTTVQKSVDELRTKSEAAESRLDDELKRAKRSHEDKTTRLVRDKTDSSQLAEMLIDLGQRLKDNSGGSLNKMDDAGEKA